MGYHVRVIQPSLVSARTNGAFLDNAGSASFKEQIVPLLVLNEALLLRSAISSPLGLRLGNVGAPASSWVLSVTSIPMLAEQSSGVTIEVEDPDITLPGT